MNYSFSLFVENLIFPGSLTSAQISVLGLGVLVNGLRFYCKWLNGKWSMAHGLVNGSWGWLLSSGLGYWFLALFQHRPKPRHLLLNLGKSSFPQKVKNCNSGWNWGGGLGVSGGSAGSIRNFSFEFWPGLVLHGIRKSTFQHFTVNTSSQNGLKTFPMDPVLENKSFYFRYLHIPLSISKTGKMKTRISVSHIKSMRFP